MSVHSTRFRVVASGAAVLALALVTGCGGTKEPAAAPATSSPTVAETTTASPAPSETTAPSQGAAASATLTKSGTTLKFGNAATVLVEKGHDEWTGSVKVTALEKAPASDFKALGVRDDVGSVYYLRYDVTYVAGKTQFEPEGGDLSSQRLHPIVAQGQRLSLLSISSFKKCTTLVYKDDGGIDHDKAQLTVGETATNMCVPFVVDKGTVTQVVHTFYDDVKKADQIITWK
jgi:hypothetical protein